MAPEQAAGPEGQRHHRRRRLQPGGDPVRAADRPAAVPGGDAAGHADAGAGTAAASPRALNPAVPRDLETICLKCLEKDPARRYASAERWPTTWSASSTASRSGPAGRPGRAARRWCRRKPVVAGLAAALLLSWPAGLVLVTLLWQRAERPGVRGRNRTRSVDALIITRTKRQHAKDALVVAETERRTRQRCTGCGRYRRQHAKEAVVQIEEERQRAEDQRRQAEETSSRPRRSSIASACAERGVVSRLPGLQPLRKEMLEVGLSIIRASLPSVATTPPSRPTWPRPISVSPSSRTWSATRPTPSLLRRGPEDLRGIARGRPDNARYRESSP